MLLFLSVGMEKNSAVFNSLCDSTTQSVRALANRALLSPWRCVPIPAGGENSPSRCRGRSRRKVRTRKETTAKYGNQRRKDEPGEREELLFKYDEYGRTSSERIRFWWNGKARPSVKRDPQRWVRRKDRVSPQAQTLCLSGIWTIGTEIWFLFKKGLCLTPTWSKWSASKSSETKEIVDSCWMHNTKNWTSTTNSSQMSTISIGRNRGDNPIPYDGKTG